MQLLVIDWRDGRVGPGLVKPCWAAHLDAPFGFKQTTSAPSLLKTVSYIEQVGFYSYFHATEDTQNYTIMFGIKTLIPGYHYRTNNINKVFNVSVCL